MKNSLVKIAALFIHTTQAAASYSGIGARLSASFAGRPCLSPKRAKLGRQRGARPAKSAKTHIRHNVWLGLVDAEKLVSEWIRASNRILDDTRLFRMDQEN